MQHPAPPSDTASQEKAQKKKYNQYYAACIVDIAENQSRASFKLLYREFYPRIKSYLRSLKVDHEAIDDLAQDVMSTIWRKAAQYHPDKAAPVTWIFTISRNRFIDTHIRKKKYHFTEQDAGFFMNDADDPMDNVNRIKHYELIKAALKSSRPNKQI